MSQVDWLQSLAVLVDVELPNGVAPDSENHLGAWVDAKRDGREYIIEQNIDNNLAISDGEWKYIPSCEGVAINYKTNTEMGNNLEMQLYNLHDDIGEQVNLATQYPDIVARLSAKFNEIVGE